MTKKANQYKVNTVKDSQEKPEKAQKSKNSLGGMFSSFAGASKDEKLHQTIGLLFLFVIPFFLFSAFISFLFTWEIDYSILDQPWWDILTNPEIMVENWLGKIGAIVAYQFIYKWFGISSFVFVFLSFVTGFRIFFKASLVSLSKSYKYCFFLVIWISITLGFAFYNNEKLLILGGVFGHYVNAWLISAIGNSGTIGLIAFALVGFMIYNFNALMKRLSSLPKAKKNINEEVKGNKLHGIEVDKNVYNEEKPIELPVEEEEEELIEEDELLEPSLITKQEDLELSIESENKEIPIDNSTELEIIVPKEELKDPLTEMEVKTVNTEYDPTLDLSSYKFPTLDLLEDYGTNAISIDKEELETNKNKIIETLGNYSIEISKIKATIGPTVTLYEIIPAPGVRISKIKNLEDDIALSLSALGIRIIAPMPGKGTIGIEVPNRKPEIVSMRSMLSSDKFINNNMELPIAIGRTISNEVFITDLTKMPHLLMAGATGQGKSVGLNAVLASLLYKKHPSQVKLVLVDPKKVELTLFSKIERHFLAKLPGTEEAIITDTQKVIHTLNSLCMEMDQRYELLKDAQVRNIKEYNAKFIARKLNPNNDHHFLPYIVLIIDEFADLIMTSGKEIETPIARLAQLARAIGIHLIIATQRPSVNIITGTIKANFPVRIAFRVASKVDSRTILDSGGADQLIGRGDMLLSNGNDLIRLQCAFVDTPEVEKVTEFIGSQRGYPEAFLLPEYIDDKANDLGDLDPSERDPMFAEAAQLVVQHQQGSTSLIQRKLKLGYNRAGRIIDQLEASGIVGPFEGSKARQVLISDLTSLAQYLQGLK